MLQGIFWAENLMSLFKNNSEQQDFVQFSSVKAFLALIPNTHYLVTLIPGVLRGLSALWGEKVTQTNFKANFPYGMKRISNICQNFNSTTFTCLKIWLILFFIDSLIFD